MIEPNGSSPVDGCTCFHEMDTNFCQEAALCLLEGSLWEGDGPLSWINLIFVVVTIKVR